MTTASTYNAFADMVFRCISFDVQVVAVLRVGVIEDHGRDPLAVGTAVVTDRFPTNEGLSIQHTMLEQLSVS